MTVPTNPFLTELSDMMESSQKKETKIREEVNPEGLSLLRKAYGNSSLGILLGQGLSLEEAQQEAWQSPGFLKTALEGFVSMGFDFPVMVAGGAAGAATGTAVGGPTGGVLGAGAGSFALPTAIKSSYQNYLERQAEGQRPMSFKDWVSIGGDVAIDSSLGATLGWLGAPIKAGSKFSRLDHMMRNPAFKKIASTPIRREAAKVALEAGVMEVGGTLPRGEMPSFEGFMLQLAPLGAWKLSGKLVSKMFTEHVKTGKPPEEIVREFSEKDPKIADELSKGKDEIVRKEPIRTTEESRVEPRIEKGQEVTRESERRDVLDVKKKVEPPAQETKKTTQEERPQAKKVPEETEFVKRAATPQKPLEKTKRRRSAKPVPKQKTEPDKIPSGLANIEPTAMNAEGKQVPIKFASNLDKGLWAVRNKDLPADHPTFKFVQQKLKDAGLPHTASDVRANAEFANENIVIPLMNTSKGKPVQIGNTLQGQNASTISQNIGKPKNLSHRSPPVLNDQPVGKRNVANLVSHIFTIPIKEGEVKGKGVQGFYDAAQKVIRVKDRGELNVIMHELGHNLDLLFFAKDPRFAIGSYDELKPFSSELLSIATKSLVGQDALSEGFAEGVRMWMRDPKEANLKMPGFVDYFETKMAKEAPEAFERLKIIQEVWKQQREQDPRLAVAAMIDPINEQPNILVQKIKSVKEWWNDLKDSFNEYFFDASSRIMEYSSEAYTAKRLTAGLQGIIERYIHEGQFRFTDPERKPIGKSIKAIVDMVSDSTQLRDAASRVLVSRTIIERSENKIKRKGFDAFEKRIGESKGKKKANLIRQRDKQIAENLKKFRDTEDYKLHKANIDLTLKDHQKIKPFLVEWDKATKNLLIFAHDAGLITDDDFRRMNASDMYAPLTRILERDDRSKGGGYTGKGQLSQFKNSRNPLSTNKIVDPMESFITNSQLLMKRAYENRVKQILFKDIAKQPWWGYKAERLTDRNSSGMTAKELNEHIKALKVENQHMDVNDTFFSSMLDRPFDAPKDKMVWQERGHWHEAEVDAGLKRAVEGMDSKDLPMFMRAMVKIGQTLRTGATITPAFAIKSLIRDIPHALITSQYGITPVDLLNAALSVYKGDKWVKDFRGAGGAYGSRVNLSRMDVQAHFRDLSRAYKSGKIKNFESQNKSGWRALKEFALNFNEKFEEIPRVAEFRKAIESGASIDVAALAARDITLDFAVKGTQVKIWNDLVPFSNAMIQGNKQFYKLMYEPIKRLKSGQDVSHAIMPWVKAFGIIGGTSAILSAMNQGQQWYEDLPDWEKFNYWHMKFGKHIIRIPKPQEFGMWIGGGVEAAAGFIHDKDPKHLQKWLLENVTQNFEARLIAPPAVQPLLENWSNKSLFTGSPIVPRAKIDLLPNYQSNSKTTELFNALAGKVANIFGPQSPVAFSPAKIENYIDKWTGSAGRDLLSLVDFTFKKTGLLEDPPKPGKGVNDYYIVSNFLSRYPSTNAQPIRDFFDFYKDADQIKRSVKYLVKQGRFEEANKLKKLYGSVKQQKSYKAMVNSMAFIRKVANSKDLEPVRKQEIIDRVTLQMIDMARAANQRIKKTK